MRVLVVPAAAVAAAATALLAPPAVATDLIAWPRWQVAQVHQSDKVVPRGPSAGPAGDEAVSRDFSFPPGDGKVGSWGPTLLSAVEKSAVIGFIPAVVHAARGDSDRATRAAACCTGSTTFVIVNTGLKVAASRFLPGGCLATAVATSACASALGSHSAIVAESSIADLIVAPRIRQQCKSRGHQPVEQIVSALQGALSGYVFGLPEAVAIFSPQFLGLLRRNTAIAVGCKFVSVAGTAAVAPAAKTALRGLATKASRRDRPPLRRRQRRNLAVNFENNVMLSVPANFLIVPEAVDDDGEPVPVDLWRTTHLLWVLTETEAGPALNVVPLVLDDPRQAAEKMDALDFAEVTSVLYALDGVDYTAVGESGPSAHWLHEAVGKLVDDYGQYYNSAAH
ncbi:MAG: hypothetical protein BJ554DRAFT_5567 [Olpidium bornovanus]|uniref:Uncharacterized protein n=1 Tax=Olpidium bornovanus TaxID=278681 RepID=A0A8H7ZZL9_9FUNG|nr:MAG: hypothetical protein BJ554DRAFT_5567 [Olpidium bornovanus]